MYVLLLAREHILAMKIALARPELSMRKRRKLTGVITFSQKVTKRIKQQADKGGVICDSNNDITKR
jgi:hypothetical protein